VLGCSKPDLEAALTAILATDKPWMAAIAAKDVERSISFWADDGVVMPQGQPAVVGKAAQRTFVQQQFKVPGFTLHWETTQVTVAPHGDTTTTLTGPGGKTNPRSPWSAESSRNTGWSGARSSPT
jgi:ketosteroid isomerase-like protein